jgi:hypothetical protein
MGGAVLEVSVGHECAIKKPELDVGQSLFFVAKDGRLTRNNPLQEEMFETAKERTNG